MRSAVVMHFDIGLYIVYCRTSIDGAFEGRERKGWGGGGSEWVRERGGETYPVL